MEIVLNNQLASLFWKTVFGKPLTLEEQQQWNDWQGAHPEQTFHSILRSEMQLYDEVEKARAASLEQFWQQFDERFPGQRTVPPPSRQPGLYRVVWAAAASVALLIIGTIALYLMKSQQQASGPVITFVPARLSGPVTDTAVVVRLADGRRIAVDEQDTGLIAQQGAVQIQRLASGELTYQIEGKIGPHTKIMNEIYTLRDKGARIRLSDNTQVYLDASSHLKLPAVFTDTNRRVEVQGRSYFEVSPDTDRPFYVVNGLNSVEVVGTEFAVRAPTVGGPMDVALIKGEVQLHHELLRTRMQAGQVVRMSTSGEFIKQLTDPYELTAFKDNNFFYDSTDIRTILSDLSRFYKVPLVENKYLMQQEYYHLDTVSRVTPLADVLKKIVLSGNRRFSSDKNKIEIIQ